MSWFDDHRIAVAAAAELLGLPGSARRGFACPACGEETRGDRRGAMGLTRDGGGWRCHRCGAGGSVFDLVAWRIAGNRFKALAQCDKARVRTWFGGADIPDLAQSWRAASRTPPVYPPAHEVAALWGASLSIDSCLPTGGAPDPRAARFLEDRGLLRFRDAIIKDDLARLTPVKKPPMALSWWPAGRFWLWRLIVQAWDSTGRAVSVHARAIVPQPRAKSGREMPKQLWPASEKDGPKLCANGLFFADVGGRRLLAGEARGLTQVVILEGLTDWLAGAAWYAAAGRSDVAVLGGVSGSFPALARVRWPSGALDIVAAVDEDEAGDRYWSQLSGALTGRPVRRFRPGGQS